MSNYFKSASCVADTHHVVANLSQAKYLRGADTDLHQSHDKSHDKNHLIASEPVRDQWLHTVTCFHVQQAILIFLSCDVMADDQ